MPAPPIQLRHTLAMEEITARKYMGLSLAEYEALPGNPEWCTEETAAISKAHVIAYHRVMNRMEAVYREAEERKREVMNR